MKIEDPHAPLGAVHQKSLAKLAELNAQREQYKQILLEEQHQVEYENQTLAKRYVDRFVDKITGNGSVGGGALDVSISNRSEDNSHAASSRLGSMISNKMDSTRFIIENRRASITSKTSSSCRRLSVASSRRSTMESSGLRTFRSSTQSTEPQEMNFALRSSVSDMKQSLGEDFADELSLLSFENDHELVQMSNDEFTRSELDGLSYGQSGNDESSCVDSKGGIRNAPKKRATIEDGAPVLPKDVRRPQKRRATIEEDEASPEFTGEYLMNRPRSRHEYQLKRRTSDASEVSMDQSMASDDDNGLLVGFVDRSLRFGEKNDPMSCHDHLPNRCSDQQVNDSDDEDDDLIVGFRDRSNRSGWVGP